MILYIVKYSMQYANAMLHSTYCYASAMHTLKHRDRRGLLAARGAKIWLTFGERQTIKVAVTALPILKILISLKKQPGQPAYKVLNRFHWLGLTQDSKLILTSLFEKYFLNGSNRSLIIFSKKDWNPGYLFIRNQNHWPIRRVAWAMSQLAWKTAAAH